MFPFAKAPFLFLLLRNLIQVIFLFHIKILLLLPLCITFYSNLLITVLLSLFEDIVFSFTVFSFILFINNFFLELNKIDISVTSSFVNICIYFSLQTVSWIMKLNITWNICTIKTLLCSLSFYVLQIVHFSYFFIVSAVVL